MTNVDSTMERISSVNRTYGGNSFWILTERSDNKVSFLNNDLGGNEGNST